MLSQVLQHPHIQLGTHRGRTHRGLRTRLDVPREDSLYRSTLAHVAVSQLAQGPAGRTARGSSQRSLPARRYRSLCGGRAHRAAGDVLLVSVCRLRRAACFPGYDRPVRPPGSGLYSSRFGASR